MRIFHFEHICSRRNVEQWMFLEYPFFAENPLLRHFQQRWPVPREDPDHSSHFGLQGLFWTSEIWGGLVRTESSLIIEKCFCGKDFKYLWFLCCGWNEIFFVWIQCNIFHFSDFLRKKFLDHDRSDYHRSDYLVPYRYRYDFRTTATDTNHVRNIIDYVHSIVINPPRPCFWRIDSRNISWNQW